MITEKLQRDRGTKKLTEEQVVEMKRLKKKGYSFGRLGEMFGVHRSTVFNYLKEENRHED